MLGQGSVFPISLLGSSQAFGYNVRMSTHPSTHTTPWTWQAKLFLGALLLLVFGLQIHPLVDPDVFVHMRDGQYWLKTGFDFGPDPFSYTMQNPIDKIEVLFCVGSHLLWTWGGANALILVKAVLMTLVVLCLGILGYRRWATPMAFALAAAPFIFLPTLQHFFRERPYVITYLFIPLFQWIMERVHTADAKTFAPRSRWLWLLPLLTLIWANIHPGFVVIFAFVGGMLIDEYRTLTPRPSLNHPRLRVWLLVAAAMVLAAALNPLGFSIFIYVLQHSHSELFMKYISEWNPPTFSKHWDFFCLCGGVWLLQLYALSKTPWKQWRAYTLLPLFAFTYLGFASYRNIPMFILAALPPTTENLKQLMATRLATQKRWSEATWRKLYLGSAAACLILLALFATNKRTLRLGLMEDYYPVQAMQWISEQPFAGRLFAPMRCAAYLSWHTQGRIKEFMDGRLLLFGEKIFTEYMNLEDGNPETYLGLLDRYRIDAVLALTNSRLDVFTQLDEAKVWALVYWDHYCQIYMRRSEIARGLKEPFAYSAIAPWKPSPYYFDTTRPEVSLAELKHAEAAAPYSHLPWFYEGQLHMGSRHFEPAVKAFLASARIKPNQPSLYYNLAFIASQQGQTQEATHYLRQALAANPSEDERDAIDRLQESLDNHPR